MSVLPARISTNSVSPASGRPADNDRAELPVTHATGVNHFKPVVDRDTLGEDLKSLLCADNSRENDYPSMKPL